MKWEHDQLAADLASHLVGNEKRMVWTDMQMGPSGSARPDVYTMEKSYTNPKPTSYEIKVTRSDFLADVTAGKWQKYLQFSGSVIFAVPKDLIKRSEVPDGCGLMTRSASGWRSVRRAHVGTARPAFEAMMKLVIDGVDRTHARKEPRPRDANAWTAAKSVRRDHGEVIARIVQNTLWAESDLKRIEERSKGIQAETTRILREAEAEARTLKDDARKQALADLEQLRISAVTALGLPEDADWVSIKFAHRNRLLSLTRERAYQDLKEEVSTLRRHLKQSALLSEKETAAERATAILLGDRS